ncbi:monooxygenase [Penicillium malachiteum]|uniref:monooxygenase n=1 Tax=Penicillium malachiteum TaxID=1324776 RepID=UPI0025476EE7|nr:monooxygenase [Penicillium malachiteum]KAJ5730398.1 monooxygenase [Penicillium malachiteum]
MADPEWETTDVLICGCGPTGAMLSGYLGQLEVNNIVLEKEAAITTDPRGIALDDDGIRYVQGLGLYEHFFTEIGSSMSKCHFLSGAEKNLQMKPFLSFDIGSVEGNTGHVGLFAHKQPVLEKYLRTSIEKAACSTLRSKCALTSISEDKDWVYAIYDDSGVEKRIRAKFLVAADGKTGFTRKMYLEPKGIQLEWAEPYDNHLITRIQYTHMKIGPNIKKLGLRSIGNFIFRQKRLTLRFLCGIWDTRRKKCMIFFFPTEFRFLCNPKRPAVCGRFGLPEDRLWRFEFVVAPDEDDMAMAEQDKVREVVHPYLTHPGSRYGLKEDVAFPEDCIEVLRSRPFRFSARSCNKWALDRVILSGDAAHVFPPFGGQGIASGFRDAISLSWRLAIACSRESTFDYNGLLEGWYLERKQQLDKSLRVTVRNGDMVNGKGSIPIFVRDWGLWLIQKVPSWKHWLERGPRGEPPTQYTHSPGMPFMPELGGGLYFPQIYCIGLQPGSSVQFTDDLIFGGKKKMFQIVVLLDNVQELDSAIEDMEGIGQNSDFLSQEEATFFVPRNRYIAKVTGEDYGRPLFRSATSDEFSKSPLCASRAEPYGYDEMLMWQSARGNRYAILRLDRFVFAFCSTRAELEKAAARITELF